MGIQLGAYCIGCCAGLMLALFALGVMSIFWMALIALAICFEKVLPGRERLANGVAAALIAVGAAVVAFPGSVPGLTQPPSDMPGGDHMGMEMGQ
jgi:predicted metal-binding membrane protein